MQLTRIRAHEFLTFADVDVGLRSGVNAITGPNGSGKTSLMRVVDLVARALRAHATGQWSDLDTVYGQAGRYAADQWNVILDVSLDGGEVALLDIWLRACLLYQAGQGNDPETARLHDLIQASDDLGADALFTQASIVVTFDRRTRNPWRSFWTGHGPNGTSVRIDMNSNVATVRGVAESRPQYTSLLRDAILTAQETQGRPKGVLEDVPDDFVLPSAVDAARAGGIELTMRLLGRDREPEPIRCTYDMLAVDTFTSQRIVGFASVASHLFNAAIRVVENARRPPLRRWPPDELASPPDLASGEGLALALFQDKTSNVGHRLRFERTQEIFNELIEARARLDVAMSLDTTDDGTPAVVLTPVLDTGRGDIPLHLSGAGRTEAAYLAVLLARQDDVLVLDEPATNLSATAQRRVITAIAHRTATGGQTLVVTHSSPLVPTKLADIVRLRPGRDGTTVTRLGDEPIVRKHVDLLRHTPVRDALFATGVLLTEGETEAAALRIWLATTEPTFEEAGILLLDVAGDSALVSHMRILDALDALDVPWAVLADGPAFEMRLHRYDPAAPRDNFAKAKDYWLVRGIHTTAQEFGTGVRKGYGEFEAYLDALDPNAWQVAKRAGRTSKPRTAEHFAKHVPIPREILTMWEQVLARFDALNH